MRGPGETQLEVDRRRLLRRMQKLDRDLKALAGTRALASQVYGVSTSDPLTLVGAIALLLGAAALASWIPAMRAARVDPAVSLRAE